MKNDERLTPQARRAIEGGIPSNQLFTPRLRSNPTRRVVMQLSLADHAKIGRGPGDFGVITDEKTGKRWRVFGAECGLEGCWCDAEVEEAK